MASTGDVVFPRCGVCFDDAGGASCGEATFVAECSHVFHFRCVAGAAGACPLCAARWRQTLVVTFRPAPAIQIGVSTTPPADELATLPAPPSST